MFCRFQLIHQSKEGECPSTCNWHSTLLRSTPAATMQGSWPDFRSIVFSVAANSELFSQSSSARTGPNGGSNADPSRTHLSSSVSSSSSHGSPILEVNPNSILSLYPSSSNPLPGKSALGSGIAAVLHAAGGFLRLLKHGNSGGRSKRRSGKRAKPSNLHDLKVAKSMGGPSGLGGRILSISISGSSTSFFLSGVATLLKGSWGKLKNHGALPSMLAAILPPMEAPSLNFFPGCGQDGNEIYKEKALAAQGCNTHTMIVEPKTGVRFPVQLSCTDFDNQAGESNPSCQVLAGVGVRSKEIIKFKSIKIYAFGLYVQPDHLRAQVGDKYKDVSPEELKERPDFLDDLLRHFFDMYTVHTKYRRHEVDMTVRLVVHYKGLKMGMVRNAFQESLGNRLKKIEGGAGDEGLQTFCSYLSDDIRLSQGSTIDIRWQQGGRLRTEIGGRQVGVIHSPPLCQAFFDLYIGDPPVSEIAKQTIRANFARMLQEKSH